MGRTQPHLFHFFRRQSQSRYRTMPDLCKGGCYFVVSSISIVPPPSATVFLIVVCS